MSTEGQDDHSDLTVGRLLAHAYQPEGKVTDANALEGLCRRARRPAGGSAISDLFADEGFRATFVDIMQQEAELLECPSPLEVLGWLHSAPPCEAQLAGLVCVLGVVRNGSDLWVVEANWSVERDQKSIIRSASLDYIDELVLPQHDFSFRRRLRELAAATAFQPSFPRLRSLVLPSAPEALGEDLFEKLSSAAAVSDSVLIRGPGGSGRDVEHVRKVDRLLAHNSHHVLVALLTGRRSDDRWLYNRLRTYVAADSRDGFSVVIGEDDLVLEQVAAGLEALAEGSPPNPVLVWGPDALKRVQLRVGDAFRLTTRAEDHLRSNRYVRTERLLGFVEQLADLAESFREDGTGGIRFADWAHAKFGLEVAMFDNNITGEARFFTYEGVRLSNVPHVKVDDHVSPRDCGRIYFAVDSDRRRIVVDHIGIHDRS